VPYALGGAVIGYNLGAGFDNLKLTAAEISAIYNGTITQWSDPTIVATNGGTGTTIGKALAALGTNNEPRDTIKVLYRNAGSGTTEAFTYYLYQRVTLVSRRTAAHPWRDRAELGRPRTLTASPTTREWLRVLSTRSDRLLRGIQLRSDPRE